jgi:5-methylcytosine-specific restriction endonuclease McrA
MYQIVVSRVLRLLPSCCVTLLHCIAEVQKSAMTQRSVRSATVYCKVSYDSTYMKRVYV